MNASALLSAASVPVVHELAHLVTALLLGTVLSWKLEGFRLIWTVPAGTAKDKLQFIAYAGFAVEMALIPFMPWPYQFLAIAHFWLYPFYAGDKNDFKVMCP